MSEKRDYRKIIGDHRYLTEKTFQKLAEKIVFIDAICMRCNHVKRCVNIPDVGWICGDCYTEWGFLYE